MTEGNGQHPEVEPSGTLAESEEETLLESSPLEIPRPKRAQGQWALGYLEPLTPQETNKRNQDGLDVYDRIVNKYAKEGWDTIDPADLTGRFRWYGLYTQRPEEDKMFMMRVRIPGGQLTAEQLDACASIARRWGKGVMDVTDRQNFQFHNLHIEDIPAVWALLSAVGLSTLETCGDVTRNVLGCPTAGVDAAEYIDATPYVLSVGQRLTGTKEFSNLPRKYKISITGCADRCGHEDVNDIGAVAHRVDGRVGFDVLVGGGLSTTPHMAQSLGALVAPDELTEVCVAITSAFRDYGYRRLRSKARLKFLIKDWGVEKFRQVVETEYLKRPLIDGPALEPPAHPIDHVGVQRLKNGRNSVGVAPIAGRVSGTILSAVADIAEKAGSDRVRFTPYQKLIVLDVPDDELDDVVSALEALGLPSRPSHWRRNLMACTGIEYCKLSFAETRVRAQGLVPDLEKRLEDINAQLDVPVTVNINGCPNSCARIQVADIGFKGQMVDDGDGPVEGFQVHLGGGLGLDSGFGRKLRQHKVLSHELGDYIERVVRNFVKQREHGERFATWAVRADEADLR
jgi:sulfite reductase (ferredoxin)